MYREASLSCDEHLGLGTGACREGEEGPEATRHVQMLLAGNIRPAAGERVPRGLTHGKDLHSGFGETVTSPPSSLLYRVGFCIQQTIKDNLSSLIALSTRVLPCPSLLHLQEPDPYPQTPGMVSRGPRADVTAAGPSWGMVASRRERWGGCTSKVSLASCSEAAKAH